MNYQDQIEEFGDGYTNEHQRAFAWSRMTTPIKDETPLALRLAARGWIVVLFGYDVHCRTTDAVIGVRWVISKKFTSRWHLERFYEGLDGDDMWDIRVREISPGPAARPAYSPSEEAQESDAFDVF